MKKIADYLEQFENTPISPSWSGKRLFPFLCLGHLELSCALGFELQQISETLTVVREGQVPDKKHWKRLSERTGLMRLVLTMKLENYLK